MMQKTLSIILLVSVALLGLSSCEGSYIDPGVLEMMGGGLGGSSGGWSGDDGKSSGGGSKGNVSKNNWWTYVATQANGGLNSTADVNITPTADKTGCAVTVTGTANSSGNNWATQVGCDYTATVGKTYQVSWRWKAEGKSFQRVTIRYAQQKDYKNDSAYQLGTNTNKLTIPATEETKTYTFTMPGNCLMNFTFEIGEDTGSFSISDFKIEEQTADGGGGGISGGGGGGGKAATYDVSWDDGKGWGSNVPTLSFVWGSVDSSQQDTIEKAMKVSDITMTPNDVITLGTITQNGTNMGVSISCTVLKSGTVKIALKPIAGYTFTRASWGEDTITVTK